MNLFPPNTNPEIFTLTGIIVGVILEGDYTADELNSIGNWLILVGQVLLTTSAQQQLINNRFQNNVGSRIKSDSNNHNNANPTLLTVNDIEFISKELNKIKKDLNDLKSSR